MISHPASLWQYFGSFVTYTLTTVGVIYGVYWYTRRASGGALGGAPKAPEVAPESLVLESALPLEPQKTLYVVRTGSERFLISATGTDTQLLSKLEPVPPPVVEVPVVEVAPLVQAKVDLPWYADQPTRVQAPPPPIRRAPSFGQRFVQSVQWLVASRSK